MAESITFADSIDLVPIRVRQFALGKQQYFGSGWNIFDFTLINTWLFAELGKLTFGEILKPEMLMLLRIIRVARLVRLIEISPGEIQPSVTCVTCR